jgi:hypothetical protein
VTSVVILARWALPTGAQFHDRRHGGRHELVQSREYYRANRTWEGVESLLAVSGHGFGKGPGGGPGGGGMMGGMMGQRLRLADSNGTLIFDSTGRETGAELSPAELDDAIQLSSGGQTAGYLLAEGGMGFNRGAERPLLLRLNRAALTVDWCRRRIPLVACCGAHLPDRSAI